MSTYKPGSEPGGKSTSEQTYEICNEPLNQYFTDRLPDDDSQNIDFAQVRREFVIGYNPTFGTEESLDPCLLDVWVLGSVSFREPKGNDGKPWHIAL